MVGKIVKRDETEFLSWLKKRRAVAAARLEGLGIDPQQALSLEIGWLVALPKFEGRFLDFDAYQVRFLTTQARYRSILKSRQVGLSFETAAEALARCHIRQKHTAVCVSYNLDDAKEKIATVKELWEDLPLEFQKKMVIDSKTEVGFTNPNAKRKISKVVSFPSKAPRGKHGDVYLDELAHCANDRAIYAGATALIVRSGGQLTIGSTPLGRRGIFYGIHTQEWEPFPGFWRQEVPWWLCRQFCADIVRASREAPTMPTQERVERFGTSALQGQFNALPIEDFQQEYELVFQDERVSFFPYELILPCCSKEKHEIPVYSNLEMLARNAGQLGPLVAGFDVGRVKHPSELFIFERQGPRYIERYRESYKDVPFPQQRARLQHILRSLRDYFPSRSFRMDSTGLGKNLAEDLQAEFGSIIIPFDFSMRLKEELANGLKILFQEGNIVLAKDRNTISQIHSIKQRITSVGNAVFDAERNRIHHGDRAWAIALACWKKSRKRTAPAELGVRVLGDAKKAEPSRPAEPAPEPQEDLSGMTDQDLENLARSVLTASRVWKRSGDEEKSRAMWARYKRINREANRRRASARS